MKTKMGFLTADHHCRPLLLRHLLHRLYTGVSISTSTSSFPSHLGCAFVDSSFRNEHDPNIIRPITPERSSSSATGRFAVEISSRRLANVSSRKHYPVASQESFISTVILSYGSANMLDRAIATFEDVPLLTSSPPTTLSFNALLSAAIRARKHYQVPDLFSRLSEKHSISPNDLSYGILVKALCFCGKIEDAFRALKEMEKKGIEVTTVIYTTLINSLYLQEKPERAEELWKEMIQNGRIPDLTSYNVKIKHQALKGKLQEVLDTLSELKSAGLKPDRITYNYLMACYSMNGRFEDVELVYEELKSSGFGPNTTTFTIIINHLCEIGDFVTGFDVFKESLVHNRVPGFKTLKPLVLGLAKKLKVEEAKMVIMVARQRISVNVWSGWKEIEKELGLDLYGNCCGVFEADVS